MIASKIIFCLTLIKLAFCNFKVSSAIECFSNASPPSNIFLLIEIVEVVVSSSTKEPSELLSLFVELKTVVKVFFQSFEELASPSECFAAANL